MWKEEPVLWFKQTLASVHGIPNYSLMSETYSILLMMEFSIKAAAANSRSSAWR